MYEVIRIMVIVGTIASAVSGSLVAIGASLDMFGVLFVGCATAVGGGGILRDILVGNTPYVFKKHIYAVAAIFGSLLYFVMKTYVGNVVLNSVIPMILIVMIRILATKYRWNFSKIHIGNGK